jgi:ATP-dependent Clp protease ATP-binding subunit ClpB
MEAFAGNVQAGIFKRIDDIVSLLRLSLEDIHRIVDIQLGLIRKRLQERKISLELTDAAKKYIAQEGLSPVYGARPTESALCRKESWIRWRWIFWPENLQKEIPSLSVFQR